MAIHFNCGICGQTMEVPDDMAGSRGRCPKCNNAVDIPQQPAAAPPPTSLGAASVGQTPPRPDAVPGTHQGAVTPSLAAPADFVRALFDVNFHSFLTTKVIKLIYILVLVVLTLSWGVAFLSGLGTALGMMKDSVLMGGVVLLAALIAIPLGYLLSVVWIRVSLELVIILFRIAEDVHRTASRP
ncbi:MAG TPA: DUF4282 domain-containing protein [Thermoguttaceae bacterium]|nr:DUF4282 domain-containing protein [Thermoguttaceae bacterium]